MTKTVFGVYEHGIIRLLSKLPLTEHQKIEIQFDVPASAAQTTRAIIRIKHKIAKIVADSRDFSPFNS